MVRKIEKKVLEGNIWKFYLFQVFRNLVFFLPIVVLFWQDNGLSMTEIMLLQSIFAIMVVLFEIPTGFFADIYGRRKSLIISVFCLLFAIIIYGVGTGFYHFLLAEIFFAFGGSLISGSDSALIYDTLKDLKRENEYKKIWGNSIFLLLIAIAIGNILGGFIGKIDFRWTFFVMVPFFIILIPISISMKEPKRHKMIFKKGYVYELVKIIRHSLFDSKRLKWLIIYSGVVYAFNQSALWLYQPYFSLSGLDIVHFGFIFASFQIVAAVASKYAHKIEEKIGEKYSLIMLIVLVSISYFLMSNFVYLFSFSFAFLQQFVRGFSKVVISDYINKITKSSIRATVLSVKNMVGQLLYAVIIPIIGWIVDIYSLIEALFVLGFTSLFIGGFVLIIFLFINRNQAPQ